MHFTGGKKTDLIGKKTKKRNRFHLLKTRTLEKKEAGGEAVSLGWEVKKEK